jgi:hypothetical protein
MKSYSSGASSLSASQVPPSLRQSADLLRAKKELEAQKEATVVESSPNLLLRSLFFS